MITYKAWTSTCWQTKNPILCFLCWKTFFVIEIDNILCWYHSRWHKDFRVLSTMKLQMNAPYNFRTLDFFFFSKFHACATCWFLHKLEWKEKTKYPYIIICNSYSCSIGNVLSFLSAIKGKNLIGLSRIFV